MSADPVHIRPAGPVADGPVVDVQFGDLPPSRRGGDTAWVGEVVTVLQTRPGDWACVRTWPPGTDSGRSGSHRARLIAKGCEATTRQGTFGVQLWARWPA